MYLVGKVFVDNMIVETLIVSLLLLVTIRWRRASAGFLAVTPLLLLGIQLRHVPKIKDLTFIWAAMVVVATLLDLFDNRYRPLNLLAKTEMRLLALISIVVTLSHMLNYDAHNVNATFQFRLFVAGTAVPLLCMAILVHDRQSLREWGVGAGLGLGIIIMGTAITTLTLMYRLPPSHYFRIRGSTFLGWRLASISSYAAWGTILMAVGLQVPNQRAIKSLLGVVALLLCGLAIVSGASRATLAGMAVTFVVFGYLSFIKRRNKVSLWPLALAALLAVGFLGGSRLSVLQRAFIDRLYSISIYEDPAFQGRLELIEGAWDKFVGSPMWGVGIANAGKVEYVLEWEGYVTVSGVHGIWMQILSEQGLLGLLPFVALFWRGVARSLKMVRYSSSSSFYAIGLSCFLTLTYLFVESLLAGGLECFLLPFLSCIAYDIWQREQPSTVSDKAGGKYSRVDATAATAKGV